MKLNLPEKMRELFAGLIRPRERLNVWQWAEKHVDYSRIPNYDTPFHGMYDPDFIPMWKTVVEWLTDPTIREVAVVKATRLGGSENAIINTIAYHVSERPLPTLYLTSDQLTAERFMERRVKRRLKASKRTAVALRESQSTQHDIAFRTMDFRVSWPRSKHAFKQDGWALVFCDETSVWPEYATDMARRRIDSYPFPHILFMSSADPMSKRTSDEDPIFIEWERGDKQEWMCEDPGGGERFKMEMGTAEADGLHWDPDAKREDGTWDFERVRESAHYVTPSGAKIYNCDRLKVALTGRFVPTATETAAPGCKSARMNSFLSPFSAGDFGNIAVAFLKAKASVNGMKAFAYEYLAEKYYQKKESINDDELMARCRDYLMGIITAAPFMGKDREGVVFITVDVQKGHMWYVVREWWPDGDSALLDWGYAVEWEQIEALADKYHAVRVFPDCGYEERAIEVYEYALESKALPLRGSDSLKFLPVKEYAVNPWEGRRGGKDDDRQIVTYIFNTDIFKTHLSSLMGGTSRKKWALPKDTPGKYFNQAGSEEKVDGIWKTKKGRPNNHIADCETMQLVAAFLHGLYRVIVMEENAEDETGANDES